ncbi:MAG: hypothetical protein PHV30_02325 [Candidatus Margulisbacteria bacterium]|nr:hypothetical protein [Candidatus Margulisiibacteriota bacterium]
MFSCHKIISLYSDASYLGWRELSRDSRIALRNGDIAKLKGIFGENLPYLFDVFRDKPLHHETQQKLPRLKNSELLLLNENNFPESILKIALRMGYKYGQNIPLSSADFFQRSKFEKYRQRAEFNFFKVVQKDAEPFWRGQDPYKGLLFLERFWTIYRDMLLKPDRFPYAQAYKVLINKLNNIVMNRHLYPDKFSVFIDRKLYTSRFINLIDILHRNFGD